MGYHYNLAQLISLQVIDGDSVLLFLEMTQMMRGRNVKDAIAQNPVSISLRRRKKEQNVKQQEREVLANSLLNTVDVSRLHKICPNVQYISCAFLQRDASFMNML